MDMTGSRIKYTVIFLLLLAPAVILWSAEAGKTNNAAISPSSYPEIGAAELGQLRWSLQVADQPLSDFTNMEAIDQFGMTAYRYYLAFTAYFLAAEQYHKLPACPEIIAPRMDRLIRKMREKPVWEVWAETSRGVIFLEPRMNRPYPSERDPVKYRNIMYSGHVGHMIGLYETLYRDMKYDQPGSIVFAWSDDERYEYDYGKLNRVMYDQMMNLPSHCIECEPNACFPECNQHPILSFMLYDFLHHTDQMEASKPFLDFFLKKRMIDPATHATASLYLIKQDLTVSMQNPRYKNAADLVTVPVFKLGLANLDSASADGWTGAFMHAWQPEYIERHYPYQKANNLKGVKDGAAEVADTIWEPQLRYGFFAMLAAEIGDTETRDQLLKYADDNYGPVWADGAMHYPYDKPKCNNLTGVLLALARALPANGLKAMHNRPFDGAHFTGPVVSGVDFPKAVLRRAVYDPEKKALIVTTEPGAATAGSTTFQVKRLDPGKSYALTMDGKQVKIIQGQDSAKIEAPLDGRHDIVIAEQ